MADMKPVGNAAMTQDYDSHSQLQLEANQRNLEPLTTALLSLAQTQTTVLNIADFGSASGLNSMKTFSQAISRLREVSELSVFVHHVDLPTNPWSVLFNNALTSPSSYLTIPNTYVSGVGRSNFEKVFPDEYLSIAYTTFSLHWLSRRSKSQNQLQRFCEEENGLLTELRDIAKQDLDTFLGLRARELQIGGRVILQSPVTKLQLDSFFHVLQGMETSGLLSPEPLQHFAIPWHLRTEAEFQESLDAVSNRVKVVSRVLSDVPDPLYRQYCEDGDRTKYVDKMVKSSRVATENLFRDLFSGLDSDLLLEEFYSRVGNYVEDHIHPIHTKQLHLVLEKIA